jgi:excisionase family DNA binding protein
MEWKKVPDAAREWAGGVSAGTLYDAIRAGELKAARIGTGRKMLVCEADVTAWLIASQQRTPTASKKPKP